MSSPEIRTIQNRQFSNFKGKNWTRRMGTTEWREVDNPPPTRPPPLKLLIVHTEPFKDQPYHWSLFLAHEGQPGAVFQAKRDKDGKMQHAHESNIDLLNTPSYRDAFIVAEPTEQQAERVRYWANHVASNSGGYSSRGWIRLVIGSLVMDKIIADSRWVCSVRYMHMCAADHLKSWRSWDAIVVTSGKEG
ncbi:hypothetical protein MMC09_002200 [Bachmanniomyces sp. S44760]|nr:hypothetical protein [Bachmanniomyces sp. S44760]